jgi:hypothetical protein
LSKAQAFVVIILHSIENWGFSDTRKYLKRLRQTCMSFQAHLQLFAGLELTQR